MIPEPTERQQGQQVAVAVCSSAAAAEFVATTLAVHGVQASTQFYAQVYPSIAWVEGYRVAVPPEAEAEARGILTALDRGDVATVAGTDGDGLGVAPDAPGRI